MPLNELKFTAISEEEEVASCDPLESEFEHLLRHFKVHEDVIRGFRLNDILSLESLATLDSTEAGFVATLKEVFELDPPALGLTHKREAGKLILDPCQSDEDSQGHSGGKSCRHSSTWSAFWRAWRTGLFVQSG